MCYLQSWKDALMKWDPTDFGGVAVTRIPSNRMWTPDIVLFNRYATLSLFANVLISYIVNYHNELYFNI